MNIHIKLRYAILSLSLISPLFPTGDLDITPESTQAVLQKFDFYSQEIPLHVPDTTKPQTAFQALGIHPANKLTGQGTCIGIFDCPIEEHTDYTPLKITNELIATAEIFTSIRNQKSFVNERVHGARMATVIAGRQQPHLQTEHTNQWGIAPDTTIKIYDKFDFFKSYNKMLADDSVFCINVSSTVIDPGCVEYLCTTVIPEALRRNKIIVFSSGNAGDNLAYNTSGVWLEKRIRMAQQYPNVIIASSLVNGTSDQSQHSYSTINHINNDEFYNNPCGYLTVPAQAVMPPVRTASKALVNSPLQIDEFTTLKGSSYCAAFVSGSLALLKQAFPEMSAVELVKLVTLSAIRSPETDTLSMDLEKSLTEALWILKNSSFIGINKDNGSTPGLKKHPRGFVTTEDFFNLNTRITATTRCLDDLMKNPSTVIDQKTIARVRLFSKEMKAKFNDITNSAQALMQWAKENPTADIETFQRRFFYVIVMPVISAIETIAYTCNPAINGEILKQVVTRIRQLNQAHKARNDLNVHRALALGAFAHRDAESWTTFQNLSFKKDHAYINQLLANV